MQAPSEAPLIPKINEKDVMKKVTWRIVPYVSFLYLLCFIDRVNIGNAHSALKDDLGLTEEQFGQTVGIFFVGYCLLEFPSNLAMKKFTPSKWIARIMITWGLLTASMMFAKDFVGLMIVRTLIGAAEAGFFPGVIFYFTFWFNKKERAMKIALFYVGAAVAGVFGGAISYGILSMDGVLNLKGWQWLFLIEGGTTALVGVTAVFLITDYPHTAAWLTPEERLYVAARLRDKNQSDENPVSVEKEVKRIVWKDVWSTLTDVKVLTFAIVFFLQVNCTYILSFFLPAIVAEFGFDPLVSNLLTIPIYTMAIFSSLLVSLNADRTGKYAYHICGSAGFASAFFLLLALSMTKNNLVLKYIGATGATMGSFAVVPAFLGWVTLGFKSSSSTAAGTALIVSVGNLGGYVGPQIMSVTSSRFQTYANGIAIAGLFSFAIILFSLVLGKWTEKDYRNSDYVEIKENDEEKKSQPVYLSIK